MAEKEKMIRFIDTSYNDKFYLPDGASIRIEYSDGRDSITRTCEYIDPYHLKVGHNTYHIHEFAALLERGDAVCSPYEEISREDQDRYIEAMSEVGMYYDSYASDPEALRFTSETGIVSYFESWENVVNWLEGVVIDDPEVEQTVDEILHPEKYEDPQMTVLIVEPEKEPRTETIPCGLKSLQNQVAGYIEIVYPFEDPVAIVCNEEGKLNGLPLNRPLYDEDGHIYDVIAGTFLVVGLTDDNFGSLTAEQIDKYSKLYEQPQYFVMIDGALTAFPCEANKEIGQFELFQLKDTPENADKMFLAYDKVVSRSGPICHEDYVAIYRDDLYSSTSLDSIYTRFNLFKPDDFHGRSLSVGDVIVWEQNQTKQAYYVEPYGFRELPKFFEARAERSMSEKEAPRKSITETLKEKKQEAAKLDAAKPKTMKKDCASEMDIC